MKEDKKNADKLSVEEMRKALDELLGDAKPNPKPKRVRPKASVGGRVPRQAVDLGLPSGTLWAPWNVGARGEEDSGAYFAWGEVVASKTRNWESWYGWNNYKWATRPLDEYDSRENHITKYQVPDGQVDGEWYSCGFFEGDGIRSLMPEDDAATANWGPKWKMPTREQLAELQDPELCHWEWEYWNCGFRITGRNGNSIFLPAAGFCYEDVCEGDGSMGNYWSSQVYWEDDYISGEGGTTCAFRMNFLRRDVGETSCGSLRYYGMTVRPVLAERK